MSPIPAPSQAPSQDSWCRWVARKAIVATGVALGAGAGGCAAVCGAMATTLFRKTAFSTTEYLVDALDPHHINPILAVHAGLLATTVNVGGYAIAGAVVGGTVGYLAANKFAKKMLG